MSPLLFVSLLLGYVNGIVAGIQQTPVFWKEIECRASFEKVKLKGPDDPQALAFIKKRVYDRVIIDYHRLGAPLKPLDTADCDEVNHDAKLVLEWLGRQKKVWGKNAAKAFQDLIEQLEGHYDISWR